MMIHFITFLAFSIAIALAAEWKMQHQNLATIVMAVDMSTPEVGWIAGAQDGLGPVIYHTSDGGYELTQTVDDIFEAPSITMAVASISNLTNAVVLGLGAWWGLLGPGASYTLNGADWLVSEDMNYLAAAFQDADVADSVVYGIGYWYNTTVNQGCGLAISYNYGQSFTMSDWGIMYPDDSYCEPTRYGSFFDRNNGFITGGHWPVESEKIMFGSEEDLYHYSQYVRLPVEHQEDAPSEVREALNGRFKAANSGYRAILARTYDGGLTYNVVYDNTEDGYYFNGVGFANATHGCIAGEGAGIGAAIFCTKNGGTTLEIKWQQQTGASLLALDFSTPLEGWAGGMWTTQTPDGPSVEALLLHTTDGGDTWTPVAASFARGHIIMSISMPDSLHGNAVALNLASSSSALRYD